MTGLISSSLTNSAVMNCDQSFWPIYLETKTIEQTEEKEAAKNIQSDVHNNNKKIKEVERGREGGRQMFGRECFLMMNEND